MAYTKLDSGITESTIWQAPDTTRLVWITLLSMADQNGYVGASMPGLAGRARVSLEACIAAIEAFLAPDKWSRTKDHDGRRVADADGGWILLNHAKYRAAQNAEDRRERSRIAMAELRNKRKQALTVNTSESALSKLPQAEAEAEIEKKNTPPAARSHPAGAGKKPKEVGLETLIAEGVDPKVARDWLLIRKAKKSLLTETSWEGVKREAAAAGLTPAQAVKHAAESNWQGFKAAWIANDAKKNGAASSDLENLFRRGASRGAT
jgi:hypothetical protein